MAQDPKVKFSGVPKETILKKISTVPVFLLSSIFGFGMFKFKLFISHFKIDMTFSTYTFHLTLLKNISSNKPLERKKNLIDTRRESFQVRTAFGFGENFYTKGDLRVGCYFAALYLVYHAPGVGG
uniref:Uncharacterized protein n=2 Tax=Cacopsylla melanoneura TaxID=428564 RepID=A0A8D9EXN7_9HEMI